MRLFNGVFWSIFLILTGIIVVVKHLFRLNFITGRIIFGIFVLLIGVSLLFGGSFAFFGNHSIVNVSDKNDIILGNGYFSSDEVNTNGSNAEYNIIFGSGTLDLSEITFPGGNDTRSIKVNCVFGSAEIRIPKNVQVRIKANSAFGRTELPDGSSTTFGERNYTNTDNQQMRSLLEIETNSVFGSITIR